MQNCAAVQYLLLPNFAFAVFTENRKKRTGGSIKFTHSLLYFHNFVTLENAIRYGKSSTVTVKKSGDLIQRYLKRQKIVKQRSSGLDDMTSAGNVNT